MNEERIKKLIRELIIEIGEDPTREGLAKTPERVADAYKEIFVEGYYRKNGVFVKSHVRKITVLGSPAAFASTAFSMWDLG